MLDCIDHGRKGNAQGYASKRHEGKPMGYHRVVFFEANGYWPEVVRHTCDNPRCINPAHLIAGTHADNSRDMVERGRSISGEAHLDAKLTWKDVEWIRANYVKGSRELGSTAMAKRFGMHSSAIRRLMRGETWCEN